MSRGKTILWIVVAAAAALAAVLVLRAHLWRAKFTTLQGAVIRRSKDPEKQFPVADVLVTASHGSVVASARTDASGYFKIIFPQVIWPGQTVELSFRNPDFRPLDIPLRMAFRSTSRRLTIAAMQPLSQQIASAPGVRPIRVKNIRVRYTVNSRQEDNIGSIARTFKVVNQGNIPCRHHAPCSPDGTWKASVGSITLDAGPGNEYENVRASCIAGPCPFTQIDSSGFAQGGRKITASALDWSDTATFLVEAEVSHSYIASNVRESYPVIYARTLNFTLPPTQEGVSIEAEVNGTPMIFPLGPDLYLSWATCMERNSSETEKSTTYRCELKPGYAF